MLINVINVPKPCLWLCLCAKRDYTTKTRLLYYFCNSTKALSGLDLSSRSICNVNFQLKETSEAAELKPKDFVSGDGECPRGPCASYESVTIACVRAQPRRKRDVPLRDALAHRDATGHESLMKTDIDHGTFLRGNTVSSNAISDAATCEKMRSFECGLTQESEDDAFLNGE